MKIANNWNFDSLNNDGTGAKVFACQRQIHQCTDGQDSITAHILLVKDVHETNFKRFEEFSNLHNYFKIHVFVSIYPFLVVS